MRLLESKQTGSPAETDRLVLDVIKSKGDQPIRLWNLRIETNLPNPLLNKCLNNLQASALIKEVHNAQVKGKHYIAAEFKPAKDFLWYDENGQLDTVFIDLLQDVCLIIIRQLKVATAEGVYEFFNKKRVTNTECTSQHISHVLRIMVLDNVIIDVKSTGLGEYRSIPIGEVCYTCPAVDLDQALKRGVLASVPCGVCPQISQCSPDGVISPINCVYYTKWLDF